MGLTTDFNQAPYFDDFNEANSFYRVLFKPGVALQARELTQLQTILQNQIERFGNNILVDGTIIQGCNFSEIDNLAYIKILDLNTNGQPVSMSSYDGLKIIGATTGVSGVIQTYANGLESQDPDLNTLFFKYTGSGNPNTEIKTFNSTENLYLLNTSNTIIDTVTAAGSILTVPANAVGKAYGIKTGDGIIYQKGFFSRVEEQLTVVSKYTNSPNNVVVGFSTDESIINSNADTSLLDNANGFNNYNAPGADRLKLTPILVTKTTDEAIANSSFFAIQEYAYGRVIRRNNDTQYSTIMSVIEKRTKEESGNYIVNDFVINTSDSANTSAIALDVNKGLAYVEGKRVELLDKISLDLPKSSTYLTESSQNISTNYGNYILVKEFMGRFDTHLGANVALYDTVQTNVTDGSIGSAAGTSIGTAKIMAITYDSGTIGSNTAIYKAYISDITMASTKKWDDVKALVYATNVGTADLITTTIYDQSFKRRVFNVGRSAIKAIPAANTTTYFTLRTVNNSLTMSSGGVLSFTLTSGEWPYSVGALTTDQKKDLILVAGATSSPYVANRPIDLTSATATVTNTTNISITVGAPAGSISNCILYHNVKKDGINAPTQKILETVYVKIACNTATTNSTGPWSLGFPDVYSIDNVYVGDTTIGYQDANTAADKTSFFVLNSNQKDDYYGLATISKKSGLSLVANSNLVVKLTRFKKGITDNGFFSVLSYPIDDANTANTSAIQTYEIPTFTSSDGAIYDLRDVVDFRPYSVNTAANSVTSASASVNPSATISFNTGGLVPTPNKELVADYEYYLARKDLLMIDTTGNIVLKSGTPAETPIAPADPSVGMVLADISIPPFPSLTAKLANAVKRNQYGVSLSKRNNRRYTMRDVGQIDTRVNNLEYYTALSLLETTTKDLIITGADGLNRFKNGILVDNFSDLLGANIDDPEYNAGYNVSTQEISPIFRLYPLTIKPDLTATNANVSVGISTVTLRKNTDSVLINQPYATGSRRLADQFWSFKGNARIYPSFDGGWDTNITPEPSFDVDSTSIYRYSTTGNAIRTTGANKTGTNIEQTAFQSAYMRPQNVRIRATGLRPNARHYFAFDKKNVNAFCAPGKFLTGSTNLVDIYSTDPDGTTVTSDSGGNLTAVFTIPANTFLVGERLLEIGDVNDFTLTPDAYTSYSNIAYTGFNPPRPTPRRQNRDPLAQTFRIDRDAGKDSVLMLSKLELYFKQKPVDANIGVTIEIRETVNGYPSSNSIVKNGVVYLENSSISTTVKTIVTFAEPVELKTDTEYAFVALPDNDHPDYYIHLSKVGGYDPVAKINVTHDTFDGTLFTSTNGRAWTPYQDENAKFTLYTGQYDKSGYQHFTNTDHEFFTIVPTSNSFVGSELVAKVAANLTQTITTVKSNTEIAYSGTTLVGTIAAGDFIGYWANTTVIDTLKVLSANTTKIVVDRLPKYANTSANIFKTVVGEVSYQDTSKTILHLTNSSASASYLFANNDIIRGTKSQATATITTVNALKVSSIQANIVDSNYLYTDSKYEVSIIRDSTGITNIATNQPLSIDDDNLFNKNPATISSKSLLPADRGFRIKASLSNSQTTAPYDSTPIIDFGASTINVIEYLVNNDSTNETKALGGNALSKYITLPTTLAENLDADDLTVYLTAYRPAGTTIEIYSRFKNKSDPRLFDEIEWTELTLKDSSNLTSSSADVFDYRELQYVMPSVATDASLTNGGGAALNIANSNTLTYKDPAGAVYTGYKQYAIKIVFLATDYSSVPKVKDLRAIALT
jgi:hypothetical protein